MQFWIWETILVAVGSTPSLIAIIEFAMDEVFDDDFNVDTGDAFFNDLLT
jgi:hypothetical protein